ncbi:uncharacterized protein [Rutidosis leptorrhynchoides]|uniref:uncharacterized protein n=1 Tax=Rutidosis leptorrhynchoides TaxID=125765 RepID=UPI003A998979
MIVKARERRRRDIDNIKFIKDEAGQTIVKEDEIRKIWEGYFSSLFIGGVPGHREDLQDLGIEQFQNNNFCRRISHEEVRLALQKIGRNKAVGPDQIPREAWRFLGDDGMNTPTMKLWERVIKNRLRRESTASENQFGFMPEHSSMEAIHIIRSLMEKYREKQKRLEIVLLDLEKAYDCVPRKLIWKTLNILHQNQNQTTSVPEKQKYPESGMSRSRRMISQARDVTKTDPNSALDLISPTQNRLILS